MKTTKIDEIEDLADGVPVLIVEGQVKVAMDVQHGTSQGRNGKPGIDWSRQFFVLSSGTADIGCTMFGADGNEMVKGETVRIENVQNKKGQWSGMIKESYTDKQGVLKHSLKISADQVKITHPDQQGAMTNEGIDSTYKRIDETKSKGEHCQEPLTDEPQSPPPRPNGNPVNAHGDDRFQKIEGVVEARKHLMQSANLYNLCVDAVDKAIAPWMPEVARTSEQFQAAVASLFIEASKEQWWSGKIVKPSLVDSMPTTPIKK